MREQPALLKHVADAAAMRRDKDAARSVGQYRVVDRDAAGVGPVEPGDRVDQRGLAGAGAAEEGGEAASALERGVQREGPQAMRDGDAEH